jgi:hypothetical protein
VAKLIEVHLGEGHRLAIRLRTATAKAQAEHRRPGRPTNEKSDRRQLPQQQQPPAKCVERYTEAVDNKRLAAEAARKHAMLGEARNP